MIANDRLIPPALTVVAFLFLLSGLIASAGAVSTLFGPFIHVDADVLGIPIFFGLRRYSRGWRICALVMIWVEMLMVPCALLDAVLSGSFGGSFLGWHFHAFPTLFFVLACLVLFSIALWQYRVLTRSEIRTLFYPASQQLVAVAENP
jgi:hypothetical protein